MHLQCNVSGSNCIIQKHPANPNILSPPDLLTCQNLYVPLHCWHYTENRITPLRTVGRVSSVSSCCDTRDKRSAHNMFMVSTMIKSPNTILKINKCTLHNHPKTKGQTKLKFGKNIVINEMEAVCNPKFHSVA